MAERFERELEVARRLARAAGAAILPYYTPDMQIDYKGTGKGNPVTAADRVANELIVKGLLAEFPTDAVLAEESPQTDTRFASRRLWCVDPLDGTQEFISRNGEFVVMIGLAIDGEARAGVVYQPTQDLMYWGAAGAAFVESKTGTERLVPSRVSDPKSATFVVSRSHRSSTVTAVVEKLAAAKQEPLGSVGLKAVRVAGGSAEVYLSVSKNTNEWDACAPEAILRAAGGLMTDCLGDPLRYNKAVTDTPRGLLASNGLLHPACVEAVRPFGKERGWY